MTEQEYMKKVEVALGKSGYLTVFPILSIDTHKPEVRANINLKDFHWVCWNCRKENDKPAHYCAFCNKPFHRKS